MANKKPEQNLIDDFVNALQNHGDNDILIKELKNQKCRTKTFADIEYLSTSGIYWVIEAKSNNSKDAHNTVHKIFGEMLKETGRKRQNPKYAILIPEDSVNFYSRLFNCINREKFVSFGELIPIDTVFLFGKSGIGRITWIELYDADNKLS